MKDSSNLYRPTNITQWKYIVPFVRSIGKIKDWKFIIRMSIFLGYNSYHQETVNSIDIVIN
jgi:hypothetical protein